jgi:histone H3/H4
MSSKKPAAKPAAKKPAASFDFIVKKAVQDFAKANDMMVGSDSYEAINKTVNAAINAAAARCKANGRKTLKAYDF